MDPAVYAARLDAGTARLQAYAVAAMPDACTVTAPSGEPRVWDELTGTYSDPEPVTIYSGRCRVQARDAQDQSLTVGEAAWSVTDVVVSLPLSAPAPPVDAVVTITTIGPLSDPSLLGSRFSVAGSLSKSSRPTARRLHCKEV